MKHYVYPVLSEYDFSFFRISGPGLANCMFIAARAYLISRQEKVGFISPTWLKFSPGTFMRREQDKRIYWNLFRNYGITGFKKAFLLLGSCMGLVSVKKVKGLGNYFDDLNESTEAIRDFIIKITKEQTIRHVPTDALKECIAIHVRLGDYVPEWRVNISWYVGIVKNILSIAPEQKFVIFSDGTDEELRDLLALSNVTREFYGNAFADMYAISCCKWVIASDSTFSAWGAFMGQRPIIFNKCHFKRVYRGNIPEVVLGDSTKLPKPFIELLKQP